MHESDEEENVERDNAFFALEESRRRGFGRQVDVVLGKRGNLVQDEVEAHRGQGSEDGESGNEVPRKRRRRSKGELHFDTDSSDGNVEDTEKGHTSNGLSASAIGENDMTMLSDSSTGRSSHSDENIRKSRNNERRQIRNVNKAASNAVSTAALSRPATSNLRNKDSDDDDNDSIGDTDTSAVANNNSNTTTPLSSQGAEDEEHKQQRFQERKRMGVVPTENDDDDVYDVNPRLSKKEQSNRLRSVRAGFIIDSDSE